MFNFIAAPFAVLMRFFYNFTGSYGISIILFGLVVKLVLLPFQMKSKKSMVRMGRLTGKQQELQKQYAKNQQKYQEELQKLYMEEGVNPMGGCLWSFLPLFLILPLYQIIYRPITSFMGLSTETYNSLLEMATGMGFNADNTYNAGYLQIGLSNFIHHNWQSFKNAAEGLIDVDFHFLGINLSDLPSQCVKQITTFQWQYIGVVLIPIAAAVLQLVSAKVMTRSNGQEQQPGMGAMNLMMPLMSLWFCFMMPAAMGLYWIINTVLIMIQEAVLGKFYTKKLNAEEDEREAKKAAARKLRMEEAKKRAAEREQEEKRTKKQQKNQPKLPGEKKPATTEAGRVGERPYARGRSYKADRYEEKEQ